MDEFSIIKQQITAKSRKLSARWTFSADDRYQWHEPLWRLCFSTHLGETENQKLINGMAESIREEMDEEILETMKRDANGTN